MAKVRVVVLGGPGDGICVAEAVRQCEVAGESVQLAGFLNDAIPRGEILHGVPILGRLDDWRELDEDVAFVPAIQKVKDMPRRARRIEHLEVPEHRWVTVIHPKAAVSSDARIGRGVYIASCASVQPECAVGDFASLRSGAMLGHHCVVKDHAYVGPNAVMCGRSMLEHGAHLGPGAVLLDSKIMGQYSVAGILAAVVKDVPERQVVFGNPAKRVGAVAREVT